MFNRLNRNVAFAMCLGGVALLALGCADTDDTAVTATTGASSAASDVAAEASTEPSSDAAQAPATEEAKAEGEEPVLSLLRHPGAEPEPLIPVRDGDERAASARGQAESEPPADLIFSPSRSFETVAANLPEDEQRERRRPDRATNEPRVEVTPSLLDLGTMGTSQTKTGTMTIRNVSDEPVMIENSRTSCGCTVANVPRGQYLQPGESVDVDVSLRSSTREQVLTKTVTFLIKDHPPVTARVRGEVVAYVTIEPNILNPDQYDEATVVISSQDGQPFRVTSVHPKITVEEASEEPATTHEFTVAWDKWIELGEARRVVFYTDHPHVSQLMATVRAPRRAPDRIDTRGERELPESRQPARPNPFALILRGDSEQFIELLKEGEIDIDARDRNNQSLLGLAAQVGNIEVMDALIEAGLDVNSPDAVGRTPLMNAGQAKQPDAVKRLIEAGADLDMADSTIGGTALAWTAAFGDAESVKHLVDAGADVNHQTEATGYTPLIWAAAFGQPESLAHILDAGANLETTDRTEGATALMHATRTGRLENVKALIAAGASLEATDNGGKTPLLWAAGSSGASVETIRNLIEAGANPQVRDQAGLNALDHARGRQDPNARQVVQYLASLLGEDVD